MKTIQTYQPQHVAGMADLQNLDALIQTAIRLKSMGRTPRLLDGKTVLLLFEKNSTRTRISFEVGIQRLGGIVVSLDAATSQIARGESAEDTAKVLSRYGDAIVYRARDHDAFTELAEHADVPVINALTDLEHPCQVLADWTTLAETWGSLSGHTFAYVGDGNNMCNSYIMGAAMGGMHARIACPAGFGPNPQIVAAATAIAKRRGGSIRLFTTPQEAVRGAEAVATDTWVSMGDEAEAQARMKAFEGYRVDEQMMSLAATGAKFMHCLPGHWGEEATHDVAHGPRSLIYDQAENRMWAQMALLVHLLGPGGKPAA